MEDFLTSDSESDSDLDLLHRDAEQDGVAVDDEWHRVSVDNDLRNRDPPIF
jgi:hypothetical protein